MSQILGSLEEQVMLAVLRTGADAYGMNVRRELAAVTGREFTIGSIYATLDRLEAKRLVASSRTPGSPDSKDAPSRRDIDRKDAPSRRVFAVTKAGLRALEDTRAQRDRLWDGVSLAPKRAQ